MTVTELIETLNMIGNPELPVKLEGKSLDFQVLWTRENEIVLEDVSPEMLTGTSNRLFNAIH